MGKIVAAVSAFIGSIVALSATGACFWVFYDEPEMPNSLIK